jgi:hypothetical protein
VYIGCGSGRNYVPLVEAGLDLVGIDVSGNAIAQLADRMPTRRGPLVVGGLEAIRPRTTFPAVLGIQVFQHGDRRLAHGHIRAARNLVADGGLLCIRVNAVGTDVVFPHDVVERGEDGGFTLRYLDGPKRGLEIHFFEREELARSEPEPRQALPVSQLNVTLMSPCEPREMENPSAR